MRLWQESVLFIKFAVTIVGTDARPQIIKYNRVKYNYTLYYSETDRNLVFVQ